MKLGIALDVEHQDIAVECVAHFLIGFANPGVDDLVSPSTRSEGAIEFATGGDIHAGAVLDHETGNVDIAVGFDGIANQRMHRCEGSLQLFQMMHQRCLRIDEQRSAELLRQLSNGDVFTVENAIAIVKMIHDSLILSECRNGRLKV